MTANKFWHKLMNYAPQLLMDYPKSQIHVMLRYENRYFNIDMVTRNEDSVVLWVVPASTSQGVYAKPNVREVLNWISNDGNKTLIVTIPKKDGNLFDTNIVDKDPFEAEDSVVFDLELTQKIK